MGIHMKDKAVKIGIVATILPHIFCCGLPMLLAVVGLRKITIICAKL